MKKMVVLLTGLMVLFISVATGRAQEPAPPAGAPGPLPPAQLDQLVGPIALYPDPLIAEILPAATFPSQIALADRYVSQGGDPNQIPDQGWDPSVQALAHYGNVLKWMDDNLAWTTQLGQAFQSQQADVMNAIQQLRSQAQGLGNLPSNSQETVADDDGDIEIEPTDPDQMYVPSYPPDEIYTQPGIYCTFPFFLPVGGWLVHDWNWHGHGLISWGPGHPRPGNWWHETPGERHSYIVGHPLPVWRPGGVGIVRGGGDRGYEAPAVYRSYARPVLPRGPAPGVSVIHDMPTTVRNVPAFHESAAPVERHEEVRSAPAAGFFVGGQSGREAVESSARGQASRAEVGGGAASHGGGGFSGGGGGGSRGGGHR